MTSPDSSHADTVILRGLHFDLVVGRDAWGRRSKAQPVLISIEVVPRDSFREAAVNDDVSKSLNYGDLYKEITKHVRGHEYRSVEDVASVINNCIWESRQVMVEVRLPKASLRVLGGLNYVSRVEVLPSNGGFARRRNVEHIAFNDIRCACIVGVNSHERCFKQVVSVSLEFQRHWEGMPDSPPLLGREEDILPSDFQEHIEKVVTVSRSTNRRLELVCLGSF